MLLVEQTIAIALKSANNTTYLQKCLELDETLQADLEGVIKSCLSAINGGLEEFDEESEMVSNEPMSARKEKDVDFTELTPRLTGRSSFLSQRGDSPMKAAGLHFDLLKEQKKVDQLQEGLIESDVENQKLRNMLESLEVDQTRLVTQNEELMLETKELKVKVDRANKKL